jgi:DNA-binding NarL/FixJ family response regulator
MPVDVLLVDDHKIMRDGIKAILERDPEFRVVGEAESGADALQFVKLHHPELVLMDIGLPGFCATIPNARLSFFRCTTMRTQ